MSYRPYPSADRSLRQVQRRRDAELRGRYQHVPQRIVLGIDSDAIAKHLATPEFRESMRRLGQSTAEALCRVRLTS